MTARFEVHLICSCRSELKLESYREPGAYIVRWLTDHEAC